MSKSRGGLVIFNVIRKTLLRSLTIFRKLNFSPASAYDDEVDSLEDDFPEDVKEGHFVVHTVDDGEVNRFIIELSYLAHPGFLKLLEQAEEEFGLKQEGVLAVPCGSSELRSILESMKDRRG